MTYDSFLLWGLLDDTHSDSLSVVSLILLFSSLDSSGLSLLLKFLLSLLFGLHLVDRLDQDGLVLELVTLWGQVEVMVDILCDFLWLSILSEQSSKNSLSSHPENLGWHSCVSGTLSLTSTGMSSLSLSFVNSLYSWSWVHLNVLSYDQTILEKFTNVLPCNWLNVSIKYVLN